MIELKQVIDGDELQELLLFEANSKIRVDDDQQLDQVDAVGSQFVEASFRSEFWREPRDRLSEAFEDFRFVVHRLF